MAPKTLNAGIFIEMKVTYLKGCGITLAFYIFVIYII